MSLRDELADVFLLIPWPGPETRMTVATAQVLADHAIEYLRGKGLVPKPDEVPVVSHRVVALEEQARQGPDVGSFFIKCSCGWQRPREQDHRTAHVSWIQHVGEVGSFVSESEVIMERDPDQCEDCGRNLNWLELEEDQVLCGYCQAEDERADRLLTQMQEEVGL